MPPSLQFFHFPSKKGEINVLVDLFFNLLFHYICKYEQNEFFIYVTFVCHCLGLISTKTFKTISHSFDFNNKLSVVCKLLFIYFCLKETVFLFTKSHSFLLESSVMVDMLTTNISIISLTCGGVAGQGGQVWIRQVSLSEGKYKKM